MSRAPTNSCASLTPSSAELRERIVAEARSWEGVRWRHQGRSRRGIDCGGLILQVGWSLGLIPTDEDHRGYSRQPDGHSLAEVMGRLLERRPGAELIPGNIILLRDVVEGWPTHMGILAARPGGGLNLIHSYVQLPIQRVTENRLSDAWRAKIVGTYSYQGVA